MFTKFDMPTMLVVLGATGDLMHKKIVPALFNLYKSGRTPKLFKIIGLSRRDWTDYEFKQLLRKILADHHKKKIISKEQVDAFINLWIYHQGRFDFLSEYKQLATKLGYFDNKWNVCSNKLFYIAAPPQFYETILSNLHNSGLTKPCSPEEGFTRVLIEKPFGYDSRTASRLEILLSKLFKEQQIYRIDHYLAKENMQNILHFRFSNALFDSSWSNRYIEKVQIRLWEKLGVEKRGIFYDGLGALRDVGQNHLLQMIALMTMDNPGGFYSEAIRNKRVEILNTLQTINKEEIIKNTYRAQYKDYRKIEGVSKSSSTETYFKIKLFLNHPRWIGVPFILESGKKLKEQRKEIVITFKHPNPCFCPTGSDHSLKNKVIFQLEPSEGVFVDLFSKKPGLNLEIKDSQFKYLLRKKGEKAQYVEEYEKLLLDAIKGDQTLFVRSDEVVAMWRFIDRITQEWEKNVPLKLYKKGSSEAIIDSQFIDKSIEDSFLFPKIKKQIGILGLGKMGANISRRLIDKNWDVVGYNRTPDDTKHLELEGLKGTYSLGEFVSSLTKPRLVLLSLPAGPVIDKVIFEKKGLADLLEKGDVIIDGGNSYFQDAIKRAEKLKSKGIKYLDVGISGGPQGARLGACLMVGGDKRVFKEYEQLFYDLSTINGYQFFEGMGAGHFVKMVHNGIEYGIMQAIAEGFNILKKTDYRLDLTRIAQIYNHGSVIESKLIGWLEQALILHGENLSGVSGIVAHSGEGEWTVKTANALKVKAKIIEESLLFRKQSHDKKDFTGQIVSALREQFGGHSVK
ncbi:MAG: glucose-6-phosphate dehydrogenase [Patescibacteria group bacterium]